MVDYIGGPPPPSKVISLTKGTDKVITLRRRDPDGAKDDQGRPTDPMDWDASLYIDIESKTPQRINAAVIDDVAVIRLEQTVGDLLKTEKWRIILSQPGSPTLETPLFRGKFARDD